MLTTNTPSRATRCAAALTEAAGLRNRLSRSEEEVVVLSTQLQHVEEELQSQLFLVRDLKLDLESRPKQGK